MVICALQKWRIKLLGNRVIIYSDHCTLKQFMTQKDLSRWQAHWSEHLSQFDIEFWYIKGEDNVTADTPSHRYDALESSTEHVEPHNECLASDYTTCNVVAALLNVKLDDLLTCTTLSHDKSPTSQIPQGYSEDSYCRRLFSLLGSLPNLVEKHILLFLSDRLVVPWVNQLRETLFHMAHNAAGYFGADKTYESLRWSFYWPNMHHDLIKAYIPGCVDCMHNKSPTTPPSGPLHPLPVPDQHGDSVAIDFVGPLPKDNGCNMLVTMTDQLGAISTLCLAMTQSPHWSLPPSFLITGAAKTASHRRSYPTTTSFSSLNSGMPCTS